MPSLAVKGGFYKGSLNFLLIKALVEKWLRFFQTEE
jgi:hypothetical protein